MVGVENAVIGAKSWFSGRQGPWLMVFDGADTIENEQSNEYIDIKHFIPDVDVSSYDHQHSERHDATRRSASWRDGRGTGC